MATKLQYYSALAERTINDLTATRGNWMQFLDTAARLYKYPFYDQMMIFAQRPGATACAELEFWNERFKRWVRRGSKGIALIDDSGSYPSLRYVFDISDTEPSLYRTRSVQLWEMRREHKIPVLSELAKNYEDVTAGDTLADAFRSIAALLAREYYEDNYREILSNSENSILETPTHYDFAGTVIDEADDTALRAAFEEALTNSIAYTVMARCGLDTAEYFSAEDFQTVIEFNTPDMVNALGTASSALSEQILRDIEITIRKYERVKSATLSSGRQERSEQHYGRNPYLHGERGLSTAKPDAERAAERTDGATQKIRQDEESIPQAAPGDNVQPTDFDRETVPASAGSGRVGDSEIIAGDGGAGSAKHITRQESRSDGVDSGDERPESASGGNGPARTDLQLEESEPPPEPFQVTPPDEGGVAVSGESQPTFSQVGKRSIEELLSASPITLDEVDSILRDGGNLFNHRLDVMPFASRSALRIAAHFAKGLSDNADYLKAEYLAGGHWRDFTESGKGFDFGNHRVCAWFSAEGIELAIGVTAKNYIHNVTIPWEDAAARVNELMREGRYVTRQVFDDALDNERLELADRIWLFYSGDMGGLPDEWSGESGGHPSDMAVIKALLDDDDERQAISRRVEADVNAWMGDDTKTRSWNDPVRLLDKMNDAMQPAVIFPNDEFAITRNFSYFITQDEIDALLTHGGPYSEGKFRILSFFLRGHDAKEKIDFIKHEYGHSSGTWSQTDGWQNAKPGKGLSIQRGNIGNPDAEANLTWKAVIKRTEQLINNGQYMTRAELDRIPNYERLMLVRRINSFYYGLPSEYDSPFPGKFGFSYNEYRNEDGEKTLDFSYPREAEWQAVRDLLDNPEKVDGVLEQMGYIFGNTATEDRYYETRKAGFEALTAYREGTYTLFPGFQNLPDPETAASRRVAPTAQPRREMIEDMRESPLRREIPDAPQIVEQLTLFDANPLPVLPNAHEQRERIEQTHRQEAAHTKQYEREAEAQAPVLSLPDDADEPFLDISDENKERIAAQFTAAPRSRDAVNLVKEVYGDSLNMPLLKAIKRIAELVAEGKFDFSGGPYSLLVRVREELSVRGYAVSDEVIEDGVNLFKEQVEHGELADVADFIESAYLLETPKELSDEIPEDAPETAIRVARPYEVGDLLCLDGRIFLVDAISEEYKQPSELDRESAAFGYSVSLTEIADSYQARIRSMYSADIDRKLGLDERNATFLPLGEAVKETEITAEPKTIIKPETIPESPHNFDAIADEIYEQVLNDGEFAEVLAGATSRGALRRPLNAALDAVIAGYEPEPRMFEYLSNDDIADNLFDYIYRKAWDERPQDQEVGTQEVETPAHSQTDTVAEPDDSPYKLGDTFYMDEGNVAKPAAKEEHIPTGTNFRITDDHLGEGGAKTKFHSNIAAITTLKTIESENRDATALEQETLSRYVGWGGLPQAFDPENGQWEKEYQELSTLLTTEEYESARTSTLNAHYTSPVVIKVMFETVERMGFKSGNILEPSCGVGNFFGLLPESMHSSKLYGVELDSVTARIARQLYPNADIEQTGYEETQYSDAFFDLAIGNIPFGGFSVNDKRYKTDFLIHDYFFQKTLDKVRPGGIIAFITSKGTLDKQNPVVRRYIAERAKLLGAVRLPNNAFLKNAGTEVTTDIIFLQKRERPLDIDPEWIHLGLTDDGLSVNRYFLDNPEMMLGKMSSEKSHRMYGSESTTACVPIPGADLAEQLKTALSYIQGEYTVDELDDLEGVDNHAIPADPGVKNFSYTEVDNAVYFRENSLMYPVDLSAMALKRIRGMIKLRECVQKLIALQLDEHDETEIKAQQAELNNLYDSFASEFGLISSKANSRAFNADSAYYLLSSLEILDENGELERKADMFTKRTIRQKTVVTHVDTASEALAVSLGEKACVDLSYMSELTGSSVDQIRLELQGIIFKDPTTGPFDLNSDTWDKGWQTADEYLSGNVREKLRIAGDAGERHPEFIVNFHHLNAVQPKDLEAGEIAVRLGSAWIDPQYIQDFMYETFGMSPYNKTIHQVKYHAYTGEWLVTGKNKSQYSDINATVTYGTRRMNAYQILDDTLNLRDVRVYDYKEDADGKGRRVLNKKETMLAQQKQELIKQTFRDWIWNDPERRQTLVRKYNDLFNSVRLREYDGSHITFGGMNPEIKLSKHQVDGTARQIYGGNTLYAHVVGAGKTFTMIASAMESKRLGLCQKSLFAVPNHLTEQWAAEFLRLYPSANILVATKKSFEMRNRKKFCAKIATGDYDAVIIGHSQLEKIAMSSERQKRQIHEQIQGIEEGIRELKSAKGERFSIKQLEKAKRNLEYRLTKLLESKKRDDVVSYEQLGVDRLYVDEAHFFKNLFIYTKMRNVAGLSTVEAQKSSDLFAKCRYMDEITGNKGVIFATGTPISNTMSEMYSLQRYLQYDALSAKNLTHFDAWASIFGETVTSIELAPEGTGYRARTRFSKFHNLPELLSLFKEVADIQTADMLGLPVPKATFENIIVEPSEMQKEMVQELSERAALIHENKVDPNIDNMLKITTDGRKIGLDQRLMNPLLPDHEGSKVNACTDNVFRIWRDTSADCLTQLVFCDFSVPNKNGRFNVYDDIRTKLLERGVPESEIAFIHNADTETKKKELFAKVRQGKVRILFGSTFKMGAGTNVQDRLIAIHDAYCPWRPADLEQRSGRIIRQGNKNAEVQIYRYATSGTFDSYLWQSVQKKQEFIAQIMSSKSPVRSCEDVDETALSYSEIKALCAGNPLIAEKMNLDNEVSKLRMLKSEHQSQHYRLEDDLLKLFPEQITSVTERIAGIEKDIALYTAEKEKCVDVHSTATGNASASSKFPSMMVNGVTYSDKEPAAKALLESCKDVRGVHADLPVGEYMGFKMSLRFDSFERQINILLRGNMTYQVELGTDALGNITRINNGLDKLTERLCSAKSQLENLNIQVEAAKIELAKPFEQESELAEKEARLALLNADLNIDGDGGLDIINDTGSLGEPGDNGCDKPEDEVCGGNEPDVNVTDEMQRKYIYGAERMPQAASANSKPSILDEIHSFESSKHNGVLAGVKPAERDI